MGHYAIHIEGRGIHDNGDPKDAEVIMARFVAELADAGHAITLASFTSGSTRELVTESDQGPLMHHLKAPLTFRYR